MAAEHTYNIMARQFFEFPETKNILAPYLDPCGDMWTLIQIALDPTNLPSREDLQSIAIRSGSRRLVEEYADPQDVTRGYWSNEICRSLELFEWFRENTPEDYLCEQIADMSLADIDPQLMTVIISDYHHIVWDNFNGERMWEGLSRELAEIIIDGTPKGCVFEGFIPWVDLRRRHYSGIKSISLSVSCLGLEDFDRLLPMINVADVVTYGTYLNLKIHDVRGVPELIQYLCVDCRFGLSQMLNIVRDAQFPSDVYKELVKHMEVPQFELWGLIACLGGRSKNLLRYVDSPPADFKIIAQSTKDIYDFLHSQWPRETAEGMRGIIAESSYVLGYLVEYGYLWDGTTDELSKIKYLPDRDNVHAYYYSGKHADAARQLASRNAVFCVGSVGEPSEFVPLGFRLFKRWVVHVIQFGCEEEINYVIERRREWC